MTEPCAVALHGVRKLTIMGGETAIVFGGGPIGNMAAQWLRILGCDRVIIIEIDERKLKIGANMQFETISPKNINLIKTMDKKPDLPPLFKTKELNEIVDTIHHYYRKMFPRMDYTEKKNLFRKMQKHMMAHSIKNDMMAHSIKNDMMTEEVPGLKPYWHKDALSKYEFVMILDCLAYDVFK